MVILDSSPEKLAFSNAFSQKATENLFLFTDSTKFIKKGNFGLGGYLNQYKKT